MKKAFIVGYENECRVKTPTSLIKDLKERLFGIQDAVKVKDHDIKSYANDVCTTLNAQSLSSQEYDDVVSTGANILVKYSNMTPFNLLGLMKKINEQYTTE